MLNLVRGTSGASREGQLLSQLLSSWYCRSQRLQLRTCVEGGKVGKEDLKVDKDGEVSQNQVAKVAWAMVRNLEYFFYRQWEPLKDLSSGETLSKYVLQKGHPGTCVCVQMGEGKTGCQVRSQQVSPMSCQPMTDIHGKSSGNGFSKRKRTSCNCSTHLYAQAQFMSENFTLDFLVESAFWHQVWSTTTERM